MSHFSPPKRQLTRSVQNRMLGGVCAGVADYFNVDATLIRIAFALLTLFSFGTLGVIVYVVMLLVVPEEGSASAQPSAEPGPPPVFDADEPVDAPAAGTNAWSAKTSATVAGDDAPAAGQGGDDAGWGVKTSGTVDAHTAARDAAQEAEQFEDPSGSKQG